MVLHGYTSNSDHDEHKTDKSCDNDPIFRACNWQKLPLNNKISPPASKPELPAQQAAVTLHHGAPSRPEKLHLIQSISCTSHCYSLYPLVQASHVCWFLRGNHASICPIWWKPAQEHSSDWCQLQEELITTARLLLSSCFQFFVVGCWCCCWCVWCVLLWLAGLGGFILGSGLLGLLLLVAHHLLTETLNVLRATNKHKIDERTGLQMLFKIQRLFQDQNPISWCTYLIETAKKYLCITSLTGDTVATFWRESTKAYAQNYLPYPEHFGGVYHQEVSPLYMLTK